jgi:hypothetical protein
VRRSKRFVGEPRSTPVYISVYTAALKPEYPLRMPATAPLLSGKFRMLVTRTAVPNHAPPFAARHNANHIWRKAIVQITLSNKTKIGS